MTSGRDVPFVVGLCLLTVVGQASVGSVAEVKVVEGRVHIQATAVSVSEVLDRLSRTTGMKIVYDGAPPSDRLTAVIDAGSETEALSRLLEGLGLTYAFKLDATGRHVETLLVTNSPSRRTSTAANASSAPRPIQFQPTSDDEADNLPPEGQDPANDTAAMAPGALDPTGMAPGNPGYTGGQAGLPGFETQDPNFPGAASFPSPSNPGAPNPSFPSFPGPASYP